MHKLYLYRFADDTLELAINVPVKTTGAKQSKEDLNGVYKQLEYIEKGIEDVSSKPFRINQSSLSSSIKQLETLRSLLNSMSPGNTSIGTSIAALDKAGVLGDLPTATQRILQDFGKMQTIVNDPEATKNMQISLDALIQSLQKANDIVKNTKDDVDKVGEEIDDNDDKQNKFNIDLSKSPDLVKQLKNAFNSLGTVQMVYLYRSIRRVTSGLVEMVENAANYEESINLYMMSFGKYADSANKWMTRITGALKLDPSDVMQYAGAFNNLLKGMGVTSEAAYTMSTNLTQLTYDMASYLNISNEAAQAKIQSAMAGQSRAVASVGVATQMASLQELAYTLNIDKKVSKMTQAEKTYLRYIQLMRSTTQMQGDLGKTMITPANAIRTLKNQLNLLSRAIGQVLTPFIMQAIPYIIAMTNVLTKLAQKLANFFGYQITDVDYSTTFEDLSDGLDGVGDAADDAGKKIKNGLAPFDELNQVMSESSGKGKGGTTGSVLSDLEQYVTGYDMLSKYTGDLVKKAENLEESVGGILKTIGLIIGTSVITSAIMKLVKLKTALDNLALAGVVGKVASIASSIGIIGVGLTVINGTQGKINEDLGELYGLQQYGRNGGLLSWLPGVARVANNFVSGIKMIPNMFGGLAGKAASSILNFFDHSDDFEKGVEKAQDTRLGYLVDALNAGKTIGQTGGGLDIQYSLSDLFGNLSISADEWTQKLKDGYEPLKAYSDELGTFGTKMSNLYSSYSESEKQVELFGYKIGAVGSLTKDESIKVKQYIDDMVKETGQMIDTNTDHAVTIWGSAMEQMGTYTTKEQNAIIKSFIDAGTKQKKELKSAQDNITKTYNSAINKRGYLTDKEYEYIKAQLNKISELTKKQMSLAEGDVDYAIQKINAGEKLSAESIKEFYTSLDKYSDEQKELISQKYVDLVNTAKMLDDKQADEREKRLKEAKDIRDQDLTDLENHMKNYESVISGSLAEAYRDALNKGDDYSKAFCKWVEEKFGPDVANELKKVGKKAHGEFYSGLTFNTDKDAKTWISKLLGGGLTQADFNTLWADFKKKLTNSQNKNPLTIAAQFIGSINGTYVKTGSKGNANGGPLENGEYFHMNEHGNAEFLGSIGGQKAVVNQSQMVQSLASVITGAMANMGFGNNQKGDTIVYIGNKKVYEGQGEYQNRENDRYGTSVVRV